MNDLSKIKEIREENMEQINERHKLFKEEIDKILHKPVPKESRNSEKLKEIDELLKKMKS